MSERNSTMMRPNMTQAGMFRWRRHLTMSLVAWLAVLTTGCDQQAPEGSLAAVRQEAQELGEALRDFGSAQQEEAVARLRGGLDRMDQRIAGLEAQLREQMDGASESARRETKQALEALRTRREDMAQVLTNLEEASDDAWNRTRDEAVAAYQRLTDAWEAARAEL